MSFQLDLFNPLCSECGRRPTVTQGLCEPCMSDYRYAESLLWQEMGFRNKADIESISRDEYFDLMLPFIMYAKDKRFDQEIDLELKNFNKISALEIETIDEFFAMCCDREIELCILSRFHHLKQIYFEAEHYMKGRCYTDIPRPNTFTSALH